MSIRSRLVLAVGLVVAGATVTVALLAGAATRRELRSEVDQFLDDRVAEIARGGLNMRRFAAADDPRPGLRTPFPLNLDAVTQVIDENGAARNPFGDVVLPVTRSDLAIAEGAGRARRDQIGLDGRHYRVLTAPIPGGGALQVGRDLAEIDQSVANVRRLMLMIGLMGTAVATAVAWVIASRTTAPIRRITAAAEHVARTEELDPDIEVVGHDEVGRLAASFRAMLDSLSASKAQQRQLVVDASHELRTPLTSLRTNLEVLQRSPDMGDDDRRGLMADLDFEARELSDLVAELVVLATEPDPDADPSETFDLTAAVEEVAARSRRRTSRTIEVSGSGSTTVEGRRAEVERAVVNLIDNAHKFSPPDRPIEITVTGSTVEVRDHGPGVDDADKELVFGRFYRATTARSTPGSGLGLAIVRQTATRHGGTTWVSDAAGGGAVIGFSLADAPANPNQPTEPA